MIHTTQKGFTLVEMITVVAIFTIMSSIVIFNYNKFRSDTILTNMAYEVALSIREAQIYGVSVRKGGPGSYSDPYGIYLPVGASGQYFLFVESDDDDDMKFTGTSCTDLISPEACITPYSLQRNVKISNIQKVSGTSCETSEKTGLSIVFNRPNPEPVITGKTIGSVSQVEITIESQEGTKRYVEIYGNGQIAVLSNSVCLP